MNKHIEIRKFEVGRAYARNGNAHNPTRYYRWQVWVNGRMVYFCDRLRDAKVEAKRQEAGEEA